MKFLPPVPLSSIAAVEDWQVDPVRRDRLVGSAVQFEVLLHSVAEPVTLDARSVPYGIIDGRIRIHEARSRGLRTIPALLVVPGQVNDPAAAASGGGKEGGKKKSAARKKPAKRATRKTARSPRRKTGDSGSDP